jgi:hypothetical protein
MAVPTPRSTAPAAQGQRAQLGSFSERRHGSSRRRLFFIDIPTRTVYLGGISEQRDGVDGGEVAGDGGLGAQEL